jgi:hypothetical protein
MYTLLIDRLVYILGHDVEKEHIRQALGSVACVVMHNPKPAL